MNKQLSLSGLMDELSQARTKKREFLEKMDRLIPWGKWVGQRLTIPYKTEAQEQMQSSAGNLPRKLTRGQTKSNRQGGPVS